MTDLGWEIKSCIVNNFYRFVFHLANEEVDDWLNDYFGWEKDESKEDKDDDIEEDQETRCGTYQNAVSALYITCKLLSFALEDS